MTLGTSPARWHILSSVPLCSFGIHYHSYFQCATDPHFTWVVLQYPLRNWLCLNRSNFIEHLNSHFFIIVSLCMNSLSLTCEYLWAAWVFLNYDMKLFNRITQIALYCRIMSAALVSPVFCIASVEGKLFLTQPEFKCANWSSWMSVSVPLRGDDQELLADLQETYPQMCRVHGSIQCRVKGSKCQTQPVMLLMFRFNFSITFCLGFIKARHDWTTGLYCQNNIFMYINWKPSTTFYPWKT